MLIVNESQKGCERKEEKSTRSVTTNLVLPFFPLVFFRIFSKKTLALCACVTDIFLTSPFSPTALLSVLFARTMQKTPAEPAPASTTESLAALPSDVLVAVCPSSCCLFFPFFFLSHFICPNRDCSVPSSAFRSWSSRSPTSSAGSLPLRRVPSRHPRSLPQPSRPRSLRRSSSPPPH